MKHMIAIVTTAGIQERGLVLGFAASAGSIRNEKETGIQAPSESK